MDNYFKEETEVDNQAEKCQLVSRSNRSRPRRCRAIEYKEFWKKKEAKRKKWKSRIFSEEQEGEEDEEDSNGFELSNYRLEGCEDSIQLFGGLQIRRDGGVRLIPGLNHVTFGFNLDVISKIEFLISSGVVNIESSNIEDNNQQLLGKPFKAGLHLAQEALRLLSANPDEFNQEIAKQVGQCESALDKLEGTKPPVPTFFRKNYKEEKDIEFQSFIAYAFDVLQTQPKSSMYSYNIGRINPFTEEMEFFHSGYSQEYLDLIGIDTDVLTSLLLRKKKVELLLNNIDFNRLSANAMKWMETCFPFSTENQYEFDQLKKFNQQQVSYFSEPVDSQIISFDGFRFTLNQRLRVLYVPFYYLIQEDMICDCSCGYFLQIFEFDVELSELEQLIAYRQRLFSQSNSLSMQDFLRRELSLKFEDVEYSVRSSEFLEKFYSQSLTSLLNIQQQKEEQQDLDNLRCKYRNINH